MHRECSVTEPPFLHFESTQAHIVRLFFVLFLPLSQLYSCGHKEMCDIPIGITRWITGQDRICSKKLMYRGPKGYCHIMNMSATFSFVSMYSKRMYPLLISSSINWNFKSICFDFNERMGFLPRQYWTDYHNCNILTSNPADLSNKKCTGVNNRCIRSKISGDNLDCGRVELGADVTLSEAGGRQTII